MRIANNIMAMNTYRQYTTNNNSVARSAEKLSSGYRINRAGDDAAGLAISEKMRAQVRGLDMASKNSQDAISLIQTAEGALQEVHSMLQRMNELAVQSANGTNESFDRSAISAEFDQLKDEIDQISAETTFNNMNILDGTLGSSGTAVLADSDYDAKLAASATQAFVVGDTLGDGAATRADYTTKSSSGVTTGLIGTFTIQTGILSDAGAWTDTAAGTYGTSTHLQVNFVGDDGSTKQYTMKIDDVVKNNTYLAADQTFSLDLSAAGLGTQTLVYGDVAANNTLTNLASALDGLAVTTTTGNIKESTAGTVATALGAAAGVGFEGATKGSYSVTGDGVSSVTFTNTGTGASQTFTIDLAAGAGTAATVDLSDIGLGTLTYTAADGSGDAAADAAALAAISDNFAAVGSFTVEGTTESSTTGALKIQVGALEGEQMELAIGKMDTDGLGISTQSIATQDGAGAAVTSTRAAINKVSDQRALLGAMQNRLEHKISNLNISSENLSAAESRIRDVDIAEEMTNYTKNNILSQAATAMLAQANSAPQNVLSLLK